MFRFQFVALIKLNSSMISDIKIFEVNQDIFVHGSNIVTRIISYTISNKPFRLGSHYQEKNGTDSSVIAALHQSSPAIHHPQ